jgi:Domain of Unknown Function (DUF1080)
MTKQYSQQYKTISLMLTLSIAIALCSCDSGTVAADTSSNTDKDGYTSLFDGKTLTGWEGDTGIWKVQDGAIVGQADSPLTLKANTFLIYTKAKPGDFELLTEYRISKGGNSGIQYRSDTVGNVVFGLKGYQADIDGDNSYTGQNYEERGRTTLAYRGQKTSIPYLNDAASKGNAWSAMQVDSSLGNRDSLKVNFKEGWNECRLLIKGNRLQHFINGVLMSDVTDNDTANRRMTGILGLQVHAGHIMKVEYRNMRIK